MKLEFRSEDFQKNYQCKMDGMTWADWAQVNANIANTLLEEMLEQCPKVYGKIDKYFIPAQKLWIEGKWVEGEKKARIIEVDE